MDAPTPSDWPRDAYIRPFEDILSADPSPFPVTSKSYSGVYLGGFVHKDGTGLTLRDAVRLANVMMSTRSLRTAVDGCTVGDGTLAAAKKLAKSWARTLEDVGLWMAIEQNSDAEWDDVKEHTLESDDGDADGPPALASKSFSVPFPLSPMCVAMGGLPILATL